MISLYPKIQSVEISADLFLIKLTLQALKTASLRISNGIYLMGMKKEKVRVEHGFALLITDSELLNRKVKSFH